MKTIAFFFALLLVGCGEPTGKLPSSGTPKNNPVAKAGTSGSVTKPPEPGKDGVRDLLTSAYDKDVLDGLGQVSKLGEGGKKYGALVCLAATKEDLRDKAIEVLEKINPEIVGPLTTILVDKDGYFHEKACKKIIQMEEQGKDLVPVLIWNARNLRKTILEKGEEATKISSLYTSLTSSLEAIHALGKADDTALDTILLFTKIPPDINDGSIVLIETTKKAIRLLGRAEAANIEMRAKIITGLEKLITDPQIARYRFPDETLIVDAIFSIGRFGKDAVSVLPTLKKLRFHEDSRVRESAEKAIIAISSD